MTSLAFEVVEGGAEAYAAVPTLMFRVRLTEQAGATVHAAMLRGQIRIEPQRRRYEPAEEDRLYELFGRTAGWGESLRPFLWTHVATAVGSFTGTTEIDLPVPCTYDFEVSASKYMNSLDDGEIPLRFLFAGTTFCAVDGQLMVEPITWQAESAYRLPVKVWREAMDLHFPNAAWLRLGRDTLDALNRYKAARALPTWDLAFEQLLKDAGS